MPLGITSRQITYQLSKLADRQTNLLHRVKISQRHCIVLQSVEVDCDSEWDAALVSTRVPLADSDGCGFVDMGT